MEIKVQKRHGDNSPFDVCNVYVKYLVMANSEQDLQKRDGEQQINQTI